MKTRTYPRVDLPKISNWILALIYYGLPLNELSSRKLSKKERKGVITKDLKHQIMLWKRSRGLEDADELEYKYFLEGINAIKARPVHIEDLEVTVLNNVKIRDIIGSDFSRAKIYYLTKFGQWLAHLWLNAQYIMYELTLFWLLIRSKHFTPLIQKTLSDPRIYQESFNENMVPSQDGISRRLVKKWLHFFGLINQNRIDSLRLAVLLLYSSIMEINEKLSKNGVLKEYVNNLCSFLSESFSIPQSAVDFGIFLDYIYLYTNRKVIEGFPSGRGHGGLPSKPSVQILEIKQIVPLPDVKLIEPLELRKAIVFGA
jgi:hypothetical protein